MYKECVKTMYETSMMKRQIGHHFHLKGFAVCTKTRFEALLQFADIDHCSILS